MRELSLYCFSYLHHHSFSYFNSTFIGSLVKRVNRFVGSFESIMDTVVWSIVPFITNIAMILYIITTRNFWLGLILFGWMTVFLAINWLMTIIKIKYDIVHSEAETAASGLLADTMSNHTAVKLFNGYAREVKHFGELVEKVRRLNRITWDLEGVFDALQGLMIIALEIGMFYVAIKLWQRGILTVGDFVLIQAYLLTVFLEIWGFGRIIRRIFENLANADDMTATLITHHEIQDAPHAQELTVSNGQIEFKNVSFAYQISDTSSTSSTPLPTDQLKKKLERIIFSHLNFTIKAHEKTALVGPSGSGKSTIIKLLLRMHEIQEGDILVDGQSISKVTQESLWAAMSLVPQDPVLFHRSILENIRYGRPEATNEEVFESARLAHCDEFIQRLHEGYNTEVGERGVKLSGGERQRIAIARAILRNAPILLLDEATSSLDSESEKLIQDALHTLMKNKTVIVIAHRLSTIMEMDRIIVLKNGEIIEDANHRELLKKEGLYANLWKLQAGGFIQDEE